MPGLKHITQEWLDQVQEPVLQPARPIIDPHHHLWERPKSKYLLPELWADTGSGHNIVQTIYMQCRSKYRDSGPEHLRCVGETEFVTDQARQSAGHKNRAEIAAIVAYADLSRGEEVVEVLEAHETVADGRFRGIRDPLAWAEHPESLTIPGRGKKDLYLDDNFRRGVSLLGKLGLVYDSWHYHYQNPEFTELARAIPDTLMVLDHFGTPLGVGPYSSQREEIFRQWEKDIKEMSRCENVVVKLGGLAMPDNGFGWDQRDYPATSDELVRAQSRYYLHAIDCFGPERCMLESNFPVDRRSISYCVLYNALKKMVAYFSEDEKDAMFRRTAARVYKI